MLFEASFDLPRGALSRLNGIHVNEDVLQDGRARECYTSGSRLLGINSVRVQLVTWLIKQVFPSSMLSKFRAVTDLAGIKRGPADGALPAILSLT